MGDDCLKKKNRELLKKIYDEEYAKASQAAEKKSLERQIENIKAKARRDAQRKYNRGKSLASGAKKTGKNLRKSGKKFAKGAKKASKHWERMNKELLGW